MYNHFGRLTQDAFELDELLQELEGDISDQVVQDWITRNEKNETNLINSVCGVIQEYETMAGIYDTELKRLRERRVEYEKKVEAIKKVMLDYQTKTNKKVIDTGLFKTTICANGGLQSLEINSEITNDPKSIPFFIEEPKVDVKTIRNLITEGRDYEYTDEKGIVTKYRIQLVEETGEQEFGELTTFYNPDIDNVDFKLKSVIATLKPRGTHLRIK